ncbi:MAG: dTDP-4-dehydrorhamnose 3,5-epimerase family protein [Proteobacteria bacterium]|nr:dTDP-4-dehydrorhamnose 3,5-epimerase family protein [Pseudomonadota bacterium]
MKLQVENTKLERVKLIHPSTQHEDFRGDYVELYHTEMYRAAGITDDFVQDDFATSTKHVLRGIHGDARTAKLVSCLFGRLYFVAVNNDPASKQYRQWQSFTLSDKNNLQLYVPKNFGSAYLVMSPTAVFHYKQSAYYTGQDGQFTLKWNDPAYKIYWPVKNPILSERDFA